LAGSIAAIWAMTALSRWARASGVSGTGSGIEVRSWWMRYQYTLRGSRRERSGWGSTMASMGGIMELV
jgi:hypothetical protein